MRDIELPEFTRRTFLNRTLQALGAAAVLPIMASPLMAAGEESPATPALKVLSPGEYAVLAAVSDTMIPRGGAFEMGALDVDLARRIDDYLPRLHPDVVTGVRGALGFVEQQAPGLAKKSGTFTSLAPADRDAVFAALLAAPGLPGLGVPGTEIPVHRSLLHARRDLEVHRIRRPEAAGGPHMIVQGASITRPRTLRTHTVVVGSGSGGGVAAYHIAAAGFDTIVVEEGGYFSAPDFNQREADMWPMLYRNGGQQMTSDGMISVLQGSCYGGGTVINTSDCLPIPARCWPTGSASSARRM